MKRIDTPRWIRDLVTLIATDHNLPVPDIVFKLAPEWKHVYGFPKKGPDAGKRITYRKEYGDGWFSAHAYYPTKWLPNGRLVIRVRDPRFAGLGRIVLHEMAHLVAGEGTNHSVEFYWHLYTLTAKYGKFLGLDVTDIALEEGAYKPRNSVAGLEAWYASRPLTFRAAA